MAAHENGIDFKAIRAAHPLVPFLQSRGFEVQRSGSSGLFECVCPLHKESTPSFKISFKIYSDQHAYCYGCGWYGDVTSLYAALDGATKKETAFNLLGGIGGPIWTAKSNQVDQIPRREKPAAYRLFNWDRRQMAAAPQRLAKSHSNSRNSASRKTPASSDCRLARMLRSQFVRRAMAGDTAGRNGVR